MTTLDTLEPREIFSLFTALSDIPRGSGNEQAVSDWIAKTCTERGLEVHQDELHSLLIRKPGTAGYESAPTVILHGHIDMVCEKEEGVTHNFLRDPLKLLVDGEYVTAEGTSLGADNGIGVSYILALLLSTDLAHPPLEAALTVMEEKGKVGGANFDTTQLTGTRMIDFNWITDDQILAGCGGDLTFSVDFPHQEDSVPDSYIGRRILVRGLQGGHCEFDIHRERANAIVVLGRVLNRLSSAIDIRLTHISGGAQNNVIPSEATATVALPSTAAEHVAEVVQQLQDTIRAEFAVADPALRIELEDVEPPAQARSRERTHALTRFITLVPNGVISWSRTVPGIIESSNNLGTVRTEDESVRLMLTITAGVTSRKHFIAEQIVDLAEVLGATAKTYGLDAPEFPYNPQSVLLQRAHEAYSASFGRKAETHVSNCSLELGMFTQRLTGLDTISIGTNLSGLHSPAERVSHKSVARVWPFVKQLMQDLHS